jgi:hypothetical protein
VVVVLGLVLGMVLLVELDTLKHIQPLLLQQLVHLVVVELLVVLVELLLAQQILFQKHPLVI